MEPDKRVVAGILYETSNYPNKEETKAVSINVILVSLLLTLNIYLPYGKK